MNKTKIRTVLAIATAAFISVPIGANAASSTGARRGARTRGRADKLPGRYNKRAANCRNGSDPSSKRKTPCKDKGKPKMKPRGRGIDTSPGARHPGARTDKRTLNKPMRGRTPDVRDGGRRHAK